MPALGRTGYATSAMCFDTAVFLMCMSIFFSPRKIATPVTLQWAAALLLGPGRARIYY